VLQRFPSLGPPSQEAHAGEWMWRAGKRPRGDGERPPPGGAPAAAWGNEGVEKDAAATVYVKNVPYAATMADVEGFFTQAGRVRPGGGGGWREGRAD
jgi:hypothetical protein